VRPIFLEPTSGSADTPNASPDDLADAIANCLDASARILNLSIALSAPSPNKEARLEQALAHATRRGVIVVAAAGNQGTLGSSAITRHPWVIPVVACDSRGWPLASSNLGSSIGRRGLMAPGEHITSLGTYGRAVTSGGTSAATPFVTGAIALLWSMFPEARPAEVKSAVTAAVARRATPVPPLLDAWASYQLMGNLRGHR
jgi:subtilisin family serine protease